MTVGLAALAAPASAYHTGKATVHREHVDRPGAFGVAATLEEPGELELVLNAYGDRGSTPVSHGVVVFDEDGDPLGMIVVGAHDPPDRIHLSTSAAEAEQAGDSREDVTVTTRGSLPDGASLELSLTYDEDGLAPAGDTDGEPTARTFARLRGLDPGTHRAIVWLGAFPTTELEVQTDATVSAVATQPGTSHVAGDPDLGDATLNAQAQNSFVGGSIPLEETSAVGAKAIVDATYALDADLALYGIWSLLEIRHACTPGLGACAAPDPAVDACRAQLHPACGLASISWASEDTRETGEDTYALWKTAPGPYTFALDHKLDAYETGLGASKWGEQFSLLSVADVTLP